MDRAAQRSRTPSPRGKSPVPVQSGASGIGRQPRSRTWRLALYQNAPFTGWAVARQRMRQESDLQGREARRVSKPVPSPVGLRIRAEGAGLEPARALTSAAFGTAAVVRHSACPSVSGWRRTRTCPRLAP